MLQLKSILILVAGIILYSCGAPAPEPILVNKDLCAECKMTIADKRFATEWITPKGRIYKFDDLTCMVSYVNKNTQDGDSRFFISNYNGLNELIPAQKAVIVTSTAVRAPMGGTYAAFENGNKASEFIAEKTGSLISWAELIKKQP